MESEKASIIFALSSPKSCEGCFPSMGRFPLASAQEPSQTAFWESGSVSPNPGKAQNLLMDFH
jgi:hypothetical protein